MSVGITIKPIMEFELVIFIIIRYEFGLTVVVNCLKVLSLRVCRPKPTVNLLGRLSGGFWT